MTRLGMDTTAWPDEVIPLLDEHHLVVLSDRARLRQTFAESLAEKLGDLAESEVVIIDGNRASDLPSFCREVEKKLISPSVTAVAWWRNLQSLIELLRNAPLSPKRRYYIWRDADVMLEADMGLFSRLVNALLAVAAEREHVRPEPLVLERVVFLGGSKLGAYVEDSSCPFSRWLEDDDDAPFWEVASILERPPVLTFRLDA